MPHKDAPLLRRTFLLLAVLVSLVGAMAGTATAQDCLNVTEQTDACAAGTTPTDIGSAPPASLPSVRLGNPVSLVTGTKTQVETDLELDGAPLGFRRTYSSAASDADIGLGHGWRHSFAVSLYATEDGGRQIVESSGRHIPFAAADDRYLPALSVDGYLVDTPLGHEWHLPDGRTLRFRGQWLWRIEWPGHRRLTLRYTPAGLASVTDETGRRLRFEWVPGGRGVPIYQGGDAQLPSGHLSALVLPDGKRVQFAYDARLNLTGARYPDGTARRYHYEAPYWPNHLTGLTERTGTRFATWRYDEAGRAISSEHADGVERVTLDFGADVPDGQIGTTAVTNSAGAVSVYSYIRHAPSGASLLLTADGPGCRSCPPTGRRYEYDGARLVVETRVGPDGLVLGARRRTHDELGRLVRIDDVLVGPDGREVERLVERREYEADTHRVRLVAGPSVNPAGESSSLTEYDADGLPLRIVERGWSPEYPDGADVPSGYAPIERTTTFERIDGRLIAIDGPRTDAEDITRFEHDASGRLVAIRPPASPVIAFGDFDALGRPGSLRTGTRTPYRFERDAAGRIVRTVQGERTIEYRHDAEGRTVGVTDADGRKIALEHDPAGRLASIVDDAGRTVQLGRDDESRFERREALDAHGELLRALELNRDAFGEITGSIETSVDANGQAHPATELEHERSAEGLTQRWRHAATAGSAGVELDPVDGNVTHIDADGTRTSVRLDAAGRDVGFTDARGNTTRFPTDDFGRTVLLDGPDTGRVTYAYDAAGNRVEERRSGAIVATWRWDAANRPVERIDGDGTTTWRWNAANGTLLEAVAPDATDRFAHDADARLISHVREIDGLRFETRYAYDARGRVIDKWLPDGQRLRHHSHDGGPNAGTLRAITRSRWFGLADETVLGEIDLDPRDGESGHTVAGGVRHRRVHAPNGELTDVAVADALELRYAFDARGRIVGIDETGPTGRSTRRFAYERGHLVLATSERERIEYHHDALGNRIARRRIGSEGTVEESAHRHGAEGEGNRLLEVRRSADTAPTVYRYDEVGAPRDIGALRYTSNSRSRPIAVNRGDELVATYAYNAFGERIRKAVHSGPGQKPVITYYLYDGHTLVAEADETGAITVQYVYLDDHRPVAMLAGGEIHGIHGDHLGTPRLVTGADGDVVWRTDVAPFGAATVVHEGIVLNLRLPGQYFDAETGTHYNYLRDYDPATGRYLTSDPIGLRGGANTYAYVGADPLNGSDPTGLLRLPRDPALRREFERLGIGDTLDVATEPGRVEIEKPTPGVPAKTLTRGLARVLGIANLFYTAHDVGYQGARLIDELILQPRDFWDLVAVIKRYDANFEPPAKEITPASIRALSETMYEEMFEYLDAIGGGGVCFDHQLAFDTRYALHGAALGPSPLDDQFFEQQLRRSYWDYIANGGTGTFEDWKLAGGPSRPGDASAPGVSNPADALLATGSRYQGHFPDTAAPNAVLYRQQQDGSYTSYQVYDANGFPVKRVDLTGAAHAGVPTPHVVEFQTNVNPRTDRAFVKPNKFVRQARPDEIPTPKP